MPVFLSCTAVRKQTLGSCHVYTQDMGRSACLDSHKVRADFRCVTGGHQNSVYIDFPFYRHQIDLAARMNIKLQGCSPDDLRDIESDVLMNANGRVAFFAGSQRQPSVFPVLPGKLKITVLRRIGPPCQAESISAAAAAVYRCRFVHCDRCRCRHSYTVHLPGPAPGRFFILSS